MDDQIQFKQLGMQALVASVRGFHEALLDEAEARMQQIVADVAARSANNAPVLLGDLQAGFKTDVDRRGDTVIGEVVNTLPYALKMHEGFYNLGPVSAQQPPTEEGGVGRKYIERSVDAHTGKYGRLMSGAPAAAARTV